MSRSKCSNVRSHTEATARRPDCPAVGPRWTELLRRDGIRFDSWELAEMASRFVENVLETGLFKSRWLLAPFYVGLVIALFMLLVAFGHELAASLPHILQY